uniref:Putative capsid protein n=1 Tax=viral metagenome TaxID=1070528 RepID=A0A6M3JZ78_9ZZZZ
MPTVTASADYVRYSQPGIHLAENFAAVLAAGLDEVAKRDMKRPAEGAQFFHPRTANKASIKFQSYYGLGVVAQNRDADDLPYDEQGLGFDYEITMNTFRGAIAIEKELQEDELYGAISDLQSNLVESAKTAVELVMADVFNRSLGTAGAPFICEDGMYFIDSSRPNAHTQAGTWSNLEASASITPTSLYTAQLAFAALKDERGMLAPQVMRRIVCRPTDEKTLWEILKSDLRPTDAMNAANYMRGRFEYTVYNYLTSAVILYLAGDPKSAQNELEFVWRKRPEIVTWKDGTNPDITRQRIRYRIGIGCRRPYLWRGGVVS